MRIERIDTDTLDEATLGAWHEAWAAVLRADREPEPAPSRAGFRAQLRHDGWTEERPAWWLALDHDRPVGWARVALPRTDNTHAAIGFLAVAPEHRRAGVGRELARVAAGCAREAGRRVLLGECSDASPGPVFCEALGARAGVRSIRRLLHLDTARYDAHAALLERTGEHACDYALHSWPAPVPDEFAGDVATVLASMNDAPVDDLDYGDETWDVARLRRSERNAVEAGLRLTMLAARHRVSGEWAGLTRLALSTEDPSWAHQWETVVVPAHRGHRLGLVLKLAMSAHLRAAEPALRTVVTDNAASNPYMISINEALGYEPADALIAYQLRLN